jgi:predicted small metal-binding protein
MGKLLKCRDVGVDCDFEARGKSEEEILQAAGKHASQDHGMEVTEELVEKVRSVIRDE